MCVWVLRGAERRSETKKIKKLFKHRLGIYSLAFMVTLVAVDKVYADFIVHSFITTELCFYEHYLYVPHLAKCFVVFLFDLPSKIYYSSLWNCLGLFAKAFHCQSLSEALIYSTTRHKCIYRKHIWGSKTFF